MITAEMRPLQVDPHVAWAEAAELLRRLINDSDEFADEEGDELHEAVRKIMTTPARTLTGAWVQLYQIALAIEESCLTKSEFTGLRHARATIDALAEAEGAQSPRGLVSNNIEFARQGVGTLAHIMDAELARCREMFPDAARLES